MTDQPTEPDEPDLLAGDSAIDADLDIPELSAAVLMYPAGVVPGLDPLEIVTASFYGFNTLQARTVLADQSLLSLVRRTWDEAPPSERIRRRAASDDDLGRLTLAILDATGHAERHEVLATAVEDLLASIDWILLETSLQSGAAVKGARDSSPDEWVVDDPFVAAIVLVVRVGDRYRIACVPEANNGHALLRLLWTDDTVTSVPVTITAGDELVTEVSRPTPGVDLHALAFTKEA